MYYKVTKDKQIIDVLSGIDYVKIQIAHDKLIICSQKYAEGILSSDGSEIWFAENYVKENKNGYPVVELTEIAEDDYLVLSAALKHNKTVDEIQVEDEKEVVDEPSEDEILTLEFVRKAKLDEMSNACNETILNGFGLVLSDGEVHHFDFTLEDQINMITLKELVASGVEAIPYHARNEPCKFYSPEDIMAIINAGTDFKTYHVTYFNTLKQYINSLESIIEIGAVSYGMEVPEEYYSEVMTAIMNNDVKEVG